MLKKAILTAFCVVLLAPAWSACAGTDPTLIGWWWFDEGSGTVASDSSTFGNHGTLTNGPTWTTGVFGTALRFDGVDDYVLVPHNESLTVSGEVAVAVWINPGRYVGPTGDPWQGIIGKQEGQRSYNLYTYTDGTLHFSTAGVGTLSTATVPLNEWAHVCAMVKGGTHVYYVNGAAGGTSGSGVALPGAADTADVVIGRTNEGTSRSWLGMLDDVRVYNRSLTQAEVQEIMTGNDLRTGLATSPSPGSGATDVHRDAVLTWNAGETAATHDVYFGKTPEDVGDAAQPVQNVTDASFDPEGLLEYGQTYYWRVDEVNAAPDYTVFKGEIWSFTVEPYAYPITNVTVTASGAQAASPAINTVNGSGLNESDQHGVDLKTMWVTPPGLPVWIQFAFDKEYKLHELWVWNANSELEAFMGFGAKTVTIEYSTDGETWAQLENVPEFAQGTASNTYTANTFVNLGEVMAKHVRLTVTAGWGPTGIVSLSEVRFFYTPAQAFEPTPADGATGVAIDATLDWRPGREATSHEVSFGADPNALTADTVTEHSYTPASMDFGTTYYWKVDEVGDAGTYAGDVWSFTAQEFAPIDDFESYTDDMDAEETIWQAWIDGVTTKASGSQVGYTDAPFAERAIVHGGAQSMPLMYNNAGDFFFSEAEREFDTAQNWTGNGASEICLWVRGYPAPAPVPVTETSGKMSLTGGGADIWGASDQFTFAYKTLTGNGAIIARVVSTGTGTQTWAKGGAMIRDNLRGGSASAQMVLTGNSDGAAGNGAVFQNRASADLDMSANDATSNATSVAAVAPPYWVKVERSADMFTGYISADGKTWATVGTQVVTMEDPVCIGLCVTSHAAGEDRTFEFDNITTTGAVTGDWQGVAIVSADYNAVANMHLLVEDSAGKNATATNADIVTAADWTRWVIPMSDFAGVNFSKVKKMVITIGDKTATTAGGTGMVFIDDIGYGRSAQ
ncbi:MAG: LamG-like jellyroll fold domain-containing protein [Phycisphaerales bacterium]